MKNFVDNVRPSRCSGLSRSTPRCEHPTKTAGRHFTEIRRRSSIRSDGWSIIIRLSRPHFCPRRATTWSQYENKACVNDKATDCKTTSEQPRRATTSAIFQLATQNAVQIFRKKLQLPIVVAVHQINSSLTQPFFTQNVANFDSLPLLPPITTILFPKSIDFTRCTKTHNVVEHCRQHSQRQIR